MIVKRWQWWPEEDWQWGRILKTPSQTFLFFPNVQPASMIALARPQLASHQCLIHFKLLYLYKLITIQFRLCLCYSLITAAEAEVGHQGGITLHILTTVWAFNRSVLTLENNKKKREKQLMWFHVHCVMEPNKIHCCLTADSALDAYFWRKKSMQWHIARASFGFGRPSCPHFSLLLLSLWRKLPLSRPNSRRGLPISSSKTKF